MENYKPFISEGVVSLVGDENSSQKVKILRDTGATQSLMLDTVLPLTENSFTGANVLISGVEMGVLEVPLHEVNIKSSLINGNIVIGMRPSLPVEGISLILGNDLAGEKVMVDPIVVEKPRDDEKTERLAEKFSGIFPASVVTRSMKANKEAIKEQGKEEMGLSGTSGTGVQQYTDERSWNWHMTCQCLVIWGYVKPVIGFNNTFTGLASKETWQSGVKSATHVVYMFTRHTV